MASNLVAEVLGAMITPAVLISAGGTLVLSTSNRLSRVVDRVRVLSADAERLAPHVPQAEATARRSTKQGLIVSQLSDLSQRALWLRSAIAALYVAIALLIMTSLGVGMLAALGLSYVWLPIALGMAGTLGLLWATSFLVREARLAISSTFEEMEYARSLLNDLRER
jgi:hypothetical protein